LPRHTFDSLLVAQAAAGGAELIEGFVAKQPLMGWGTVRGVVGTMNGRESAVQARLTVVADGSRSVLARALGLALTPRWPLRLGLVAHYAGPAALSDGFGQMHVAGDGYCGIAPLPDGLLNVNVVVKADAVRTSPYSAARFLEEWIAAHPRVSEVLRRCRRVTPVRGVGPIGARAGRAWAPGALLVGDAAGFFDPFTGEGIYRALRGAELVAQYGHLALDRDDFSGRILRPYDTARRRAFQWKQAVTVLVQLFVQYPGMMDYALPRLSVRTETAQTLSAVLGDVLDARQFMTPRMLWSALRP
jgi:flavin-dependent dehydrogenase